MLGIDDITSNFVLGVGDVLLSLNFVLGPDDGFVSGSAIEVSALPVHCQTRFRKYAPFCNTYANF